MLYHQKLKLIAVDFFPGKFLNTLRAVNRYAQRKITNSIILRKNKRTVHGLLEGKDPINLELGAGKRKIKRWTTIDFDKDSDIVMDLSSPLPFPDNSVTQIYASHLLEHFYYLDLLNLLSECYRILNPGGIFKVAVPNARIYLEAYFNPAEFDADYYCRYKPALHYNSRMGYVNYMAYMGGHHSHMFDEENLLLILSNAGFKNVRLREFDPTLDLEQRDYESIYAEAVKCF